MRPVNPTEPADPIASDSSPCRQRGPPTPDQISPEHPATRSDGAIAAHDGHTRGAQVESAAADQRRQQRGHRHINQQCTPARRQRQLGPFQETALPPGAELRLHLGIRSLDFRLSWIGMGGQTCHGELTTLRRDEQAGDGRIPDRRVRQEAAKVACDASTVAAVYDRRLSAAFRALAAVADRRYSQIRTVRSAPST